MNDLIPSFASVINTNLSSVPSPANSPPPDPSSTQFSEVLQQHTDTETQTQSTSNSNQTTSSNASNPSSANTATNASNSKDPNNTAQTGTTANTIANSNPAATNTKSGANLSKPLNIVENITAAATLDTKTAATKTIPTTSDTPAADTTTAQETVAVVLGSKAATLADSKSNTSTKTTSKSDVTNAAKDTTAATPDLVTQMLNLLPTNVPLQPVIPPSQQQALITAVQTQPAGAKGKNDSLQSLLGNIALTADTSKQSADAANVNLLQTATQSDIQNTAKLPPELPQLVNQADATTISNVADISGNLMTADKTAALNPPATSSTAPANLSVNTPFSNQSDWLNGVGDKIIWMNNNSIQSADIHLNPPDLGPLQAKISMDQGTPTLTFVAQNGDVRNALESNLSKLQDMFQDSGMNLLNVSVSDHAPQGDPSFSQTNDLAQQSMAGVVDPVEETQTYVGRANSLVDYYA